MDDNQARTNGLKGKWARTKVGQVEISTLKDIGVKRKVVKAQRVKAKMCI